jgi:hypothetical protein
VAHYFIFFSWLVCSQSSLTLPVPRILRTASRIAPANKPQPTVSTNSRFNGKTIGLSRTQRRTVMASMLGFTGIILTTVVALAAAIALDWALLKSILLLMQPATAQRRTSRPELQRGAQLVAHAYAKARH